MSSKGLHLINSCPDKKFGWIGSPAAVYPKKSQVTGRKCDAGSTWKTIELSGTVCPRSLDPFYRVRYPKRAKTS